MNQTEQIEASLNFTVDTGVKPVATSHGPGMRLRHREAVFEKQIVPIINGRPLSDNFDLEVQGFEFVTHDTKMKDFYDADELKAVYYPETEKLIKDMTGANRVLIFDHTIRTGDEAAQVEKHLREPVQVVHNDYTEWSGPQRVRDVLPADEAEELLKHRVAVIQVWRAINTTIEAHPLAMADARSLTPKDLIATERVHADRTGEIYQIAFSPDLSWYYFPLMARNEALVFKCYDSKTDGSARYTAHTAFEDPTTPDNAPPRESIEMRTLAFFAPDKIEA